MSAANTQLHSRYDTHHAHHPTQIALACLIRLHLAYFESFHLENDGFQMFPKHWISSVLAIGPRSQGRGVVGALMRGCPEFTPFSDHTTVLDTKACHCTRSVLWHEAYYLFGERICTQKLREGETPGEPCMTSGLALEKFGKGRRPGTVSAKWVYGHYQRYPGQLELPGCMANSSTPMNPPECRPGSCVEKRVLGDSKAAFCSSGW